MNFVDEEDLAGLEIRQDGSQVARLLEERARRAAERHPELVRDHVRQRGLAEARRAVQQHVIERLAALARRESTELFLPYVHSQALRVNVQPV